VNPLSAAKAGSPAAAGALRSGESTGTKYASWPLGDTSILLRKRSALDKRSLSSATTWPRSKRPLENTDIVAPTPTNTVAPNHKQNGLQGNKKKKTTLLYEVVLLAWQHLVRFKQC
jgi:hypothetical protein